MTSLESAIQWLQDHKGKVSYSMNERRGPNSYDCSSSVYYALIQGGFLPIGAYIGNTESEFGDLEKHGWTQVQPNAQGNFDTQRGDVFIWGVRGDSSGANGHTGIFTDANNIIHCSFGYNGIAVSNYDWLHQINGSVPQTFYRYTGESTPATSPVDQVIDPGSYIRFDKAFAVNGIQNQGDVWEIKADELCPVGFTWADNGIPAAPAIEIDADGYATPDQSLDVGSHFKLPGKWLVSDVGQSNDRWLAQIEWNGLKFWVDVEFATEVGASDSGTPNPPQRPVVTPAVVVPSRAEVPPSPTPTPDPAVPPVVQDPIPVPETPTIVTPQPVKKVSLFQLILEFLLGFFGVKL